MKKLKEKTGITLIALVITIIVLLILAGVTIVTLTGDNGLLTKASEAKQANEEAAALEKIKTEVAGSYDLEGKIDLNELKTNLKKLNIPDEDIKPTIKNENETFPVKVKLDSYEYDILEDATVDKHIDFTTLESLYGKVVNGYTGYEATDVTEWKLLYVDEENRDAIIIASETIPYKTVSSKSLKGDNYTGSNNVLNFEYGRYYNGLWLEKCETENTNTNARATASFCDPDNWTEYVAKDAKYAAGGPTVELMIASLYNKQIKEFKDSNYNGNGKNIRNVNVTGYPGDGSSYTSNAKNGLYYSESKYWVASPGASYGSQGKYVTFLQGYGSISGADCYVKSIGLRPVVCLPASAIEVVGEGENAVLNYK